MRAYAVFYLIGWVLSALAATMLLPAAVALVVDSLALVQAFVIPAFAVGFIGGSLVLAFRQRSVFGGRWENLLLLGLVWLVVPVAAALPFYTASVPAGAVAALFEATSGFTTTGATGIVDLGQAPRSIIVWRAMLQWSGGLATLLALVAILGPLSGPYLLDRQLRIIGRSTHGSVHHMVEAIRSITPLYAALTLACFVCLQLTGIPSFDAFCLALSTLSTGGFMPRAGTVALYGSPWAEVVLSVFMFAGAVSVVWLRAILEMRWTLVRETREPFWILALIGVSGGVLCLLLLARSGWTGWLDLFHAMTLGLTTAASIVSTAGFPVSEQAHALMPYIALLGFCIVGAGRFSTAGGLKVYRVVAMLQQVGREFSILIYPHAVRPARYGEEARDAELMKAIWISFVAVIFVLSVLALAVSASGIGFSASLLAAASALGNIGPVYDMARPLHFPGAPGYAEMPATAQVALCAGMILGRVEILAILTFINLSNWRN